MQTNILWAGREYRSLENCLIETADTGVFIRSTIIGSYEGKIYQVEYEIRTNAEWETLSLQMRSRHSDRIMQWYCESDTRGNWTSNGQEMTEWNGCVDIDISLTPFTNTLPIRRLRLSDGAVQTIRVLFFDILEHEIRPVDQQYTRLSDKEYEYNNVVTDFKAKLVVNEQGLVVDYPGLFVKTDLLESRFSAGTLAQS